MKIVGVYPNGKQVHIKTDIFGVYWVKYSDTIFFKPADPKIVDFLLEKFVETKFVEA
jgi:hypothetical protein